MRKLYKYFIYLLLVPAAYSQEIEKNSITFYRNGVSHLDSATHRDAAEYRMIHLRKAAENFQEFLSFNHPFYEIPEVTGLTFVDKQRIALSLFYLRKAYFKIGWYYEVDRNLEEAKKQYLEAQKTEIKPEEFLSYFDEKTYFENLYLRAWISYKLASFGLSDFQRSMIDFKECYDSLPNSTEDLRRLKDEALFMYCFSWFRMLHREVYENNNLVSRMSATKEVLNNLSILAASNPEPSLEVSANILRAETFYQLGKAVQSVPVDKFKSEITLNSIGEFFPDINNDKREFEFACFNTAQSIYNTVGASGLPQVSTISDYGALMCKLNLGSIEPSKESYNEIIAIQNDGVFDRLTSMENNWNHLGLDSTQYSRELQRRDGDNHMMLAYQSYANKNEHDTNVNIALNKYNQLIDLDEGKYSEELFWSAMAHFQIGNYAEAKRRFINITEIVGEQRVENIKFVTEWSYYMRAESAFQLEVQKRKGDFSREGIINREFESLPRFHQEIELRILSRRALFGTPISQYLNSTESFEDLNLFGNELLRVAVRARGEQRREILEISQAVYKKILERSTNKEDLSRVNLLLASIMTYQVETLKQLGGNYNLEKAKTKFRFANELLTLLMKNELTFYEAINVIGHLYSANEEGQLHGTLNLDSAITVFRQNARNGDYRAPTLEATLELEKSRGIPINQNKINDISDLFQITKNTLRNDRLNYWYVQAHEGQKLLEQFSVSKEELNPDSVSRFEENRKSLGFSYEGLTSPDYFRKNTIELIIHLWRLYSQPKYFPIAEVFIKEVLPEVTTTTIKFIALRTQPLNEPIDERLVVEFNDLNGNRVLPISSDADNSSFEVKRMPLIAQFKAEGFIRAKEKKYDFTLPQLPDTVYLQPAKDLKYSNLSDASLRFPTDLLIIDKDTLITDLGKVLWRSGTKFNKNYPLYFPMGIDSLDSKIYVVDSRNNRIEVFKNDSTHINSFGANLLSRPTDIATYKDTIYVVDSYNNRIARFDSIGNFVNDFGNKILNSPEGIAISDSGDIFVTDWGNHRIVKFNKNLSLVDSLGRFGTDEGEFLFPTRIALEEDPNKRFDFYIIVADRKRIQKFNSNGVFLDEILHSQLPYGISPQGYGVNAKYYTISRKE